MKKVLIGIAMALFLAGCGSQGLDEESVKEACHEARVDRMADDADPANLGDDWPREWTFTPDSGDGWASGAWVEGVGGAAQVAYGCAVSESGDVLIDTVAL